MVESNQEREVKKEKQGHAFYSFALLFLLGLVLVGSVSAAAHYAAIDNLTNFIDDIVGMLPSIIALVIFAVIILVVRKTGAGVGGLMNFKL